MTCTTSGSIAYIATQVCTVSPHCYYHSSPFVLKVQFALCSASIFAHMDKTTDSEQFYHSIIELLNDPEEAKEVYELLAWWDR